MKARAHNARQPDYRVYAGNNVEIGAARKRIGQSSQTDRSDLGGQRIFGG
jgi:uncharacterized protein (DUF736 family)